MVKRSKSETERFYRELLAEQARSGQSLRAFAARRGVPSGTLSSWRFQIKKRDADRAAKKREAAPRFLPVSVVPVPATPPPPPLKSAEVYEVVLGRDRVLRVPSDFEEERVAALVRAVSSC